VNELFHTKRLFLLGGSGGVGKTTLAASLGVALAEAGYRTVVLTVDPARRLASALGLENFQNELQRIPVRGTGELWATMLDTERYFDKVIGRFATSDKQKEKVLNAPLYRTMVESLGGSHEYAAMERLLEFFNDSSFDKVVVDTPPSDNARELFEAPLRLAQFMDNSVLRWFQGGTKVTLKLFRTGTRLAMQALKLVFGSDFLEQLGSLMTDLEGMQAGFRSRNLEIARVLASDQAGFILVTVPSEARVQDSLSFLDTLAAQKIELALLVLNRIELVPPSAHPLSSPQVSKALGFQKALASEQMRSAETLLNKVHCPVKRLMRRSGDVHDVHALSSLGAALT
jgi:anion-transporting  ArsA/GET3 family ATPase